MESLNALSQTKDEFENVLSEHKRYVKARFPDYAGEGIDVYADASDLGADPEMLKAEKQRVEGKTAAPMATKKAAANGVASALQHPHSHPQATRVA